MDTHVIKCCDELRVELNRATEFNLLVSLSWSSSILGTVYDTVVLACDVPNTRGLLA